MGFTQAIASCFSKYVGFSGRAPRSEFWYWALFNFIVSVVAQIIDVSVIGGDGMMAVTNLVSLALFLPSLAVSFRRLHDIDRTAWWLLIMFTGIGIILLIVWDCFKGTNGPNRFGPDPLGGV
jgi:uncharacterized membrane protein YhaH (DUF805 family)